VDNRGCLKKGVFLRKVLSELVKPSLSSKLEADKELLRVSMAYSNRQIAYTDVAYPELQPVTERQIRRQPVRSRSKKQTTRAEYILSIMINAALLFGLVQCVRALISESLHVSLLMNSQASVQQMFNQTRHENQLLQNKIRVYSSPSGIEELARNYLNMVGENELPVRFL
jgi:cell division protein FtsB